MTYRFKYRRRLFWRTVRVVGHRFEAPTDRMILYTENGGLQEVCQWTKCELKLGPDWVIAIKKDMEAKAGQAIPVNNAAQ